ncbi:hypothetical protein QYF61_015761 [Mycteria americana]|uniref:Uncharacterized protein n=1 Tax=Mycteria americana TaxID=33587 RepID=A0AAN7SAF0_MYCAM|nr:hypothetical protein QYF61_015761 [Mycteria americana]
MAGRLVVSVWQRVSPLSSGERRSDRGAETLLDLLVVMKEARVALQEAQVPGSRAEVLWELVDVIARPLSIIFGRSWESEEDAEDWKKVNVTPTIKKEDLEITEERTEPLTQDAQKDANKPIQQSSIDPRSTLSDQNTYLSDETATFMLPQKFSFSNELGIFRSMLRPAEDCAGYFYTHELSSASGSKPKHGNTVVCIIKLLKEILKLEDAEEEKEVKNRTMQKYQWQDDSKEFSEFALHRRLRSDRFKTTSPEADNQVLKIQSHYPQAREATDPPSFPQFLQMLSITLRNQLAPEDPPQGTAEAPSHAGGTSEKVYFRNSRKQQRGRRREQTGETEEGTPRSEEEEQPHGVADIPHGEPTLWQTKDVRKKEQQRGTARLTMDPPPSHPHTTHCPVEEVRGPKLNTVFEVWPHQGRVQGHDHFPTPAGHTLSDTSQDAIGFLGHLGTLLAHIQAAVNQHPQILFCLAAFQPLFPKPVALHGVAVAQVQDLALSLVEPHTIDLGPSIQPVQVPLQSLPTLKQINAPTPLGVLCKLTEGALNPFIQITDKDIKQNWPQHRALGNTTCDRPPTGVNSVHHHSLGPAIQPVLY